MNYPIEIIRSSHNQLIKRIRSLGLRKHRETERAFVIEGRRIVETALQAGSDIEMILVAEDGDRSLHDLAASSGAEWRVAERVVFNGAMDTVTPQGIAAVVRMGEASFPAEPNPLIVALDGVSDPGNVGTIIRTAAAAGVDAVVIGRSSADPYGSKAIRASMGAILTIPVLMSNDVTDGLLKQVCASRWLADGAGEHAYSDAIWDGGVALIVGSEARGATEWGASLATGRVRIPMEASVESLNASVAAGVIIFEAQRQRASC